MSNNRIEQQAAIDGLTAIVDLAEDKAVRNVDGFVFKKAVGSSITISNGGVEVLDFSEIDQFEVVVTGALTATLNIQGLEIGQVGKIVVTKDTASTPISFGGVDVSNVEEQSRTGNFYYNVSNIAGDIVLIREGGERSFSLTTGNFSSSDFTIASVVDANCRVKSGRCYVDMRLSVNPLISTQSGSITINNANLGSRFEGIACTISSLSTSKVLDAYMSGSSAFTMVITASSAFVIASQEIFYISFNYEIR